MKEENKNTAKNKEYVGSFNLFEQARSRRVFSIFSMAKKLESLAKSHDLFQ